MDHAAIPILRGAVTLAALSYAAYSDFKRREIDDAVWLALAVASSFFVFFELSYLEKGLMILYFASVYLAFTLGLALPALGLMGDADFLAIACLGLVTPPSTTTPISALPSLSIFINALLISCSYPLVLLARNLVLIARGVDLFDGVEVSTAGKLLALFTLTRVPVRVYLSRRYAYALAETVEGGKRRILFRARVGEASTQPQSDWVWVSPYIPFVVMLTVGYVVHLLYGCLLDPLFAP